MSNDSSNSIWRDIIVAGVAAIVTVLVSKGCDRISPEDNRVIISDTLRVIETHAPQNDDSLLFTAITELNRTIRETAKTNNNIQIVMPESGVSAGHERQDPHLVEGIAPTSSVGYSFNRVETQEFHSNLNRTIDKKGFYKKGYTISDGGAFYVLEKKPNVEDSFLTFEIRLFQPAYMLSHIYLNICNTNEKGELYQFFGQAYEVKDGLNRIMIANNLREGKNRVEIGVFMKSDEGKDFPTYYRSIFTLIK